jgi:hypothetical protein
VKVRSTYHRIFYQLEDDYRRQVMEYLAWCGKGLTTCWKRPDFALDAVAVTVERVINL